MKMPETFEAALHNSFLRAWRDESQHDEWINVANIHSIYLDIIDGVGTVFIALDSGGEYRIESHRVLRRLHFLREWSHEQEQ